MLSLHVLTLRVLFVASRLVDLDNACCSGEGQDCDGGVPTTCGVACGASLLPLLSDCGVTINRMFDGDDGVIDGTATEFVTLRATCVSISLNALLSYIKQLQSSGCHLSLNGVAGASFLGHCLEFSIGKCGIPP